MKPFAVTFFPNRFATDKFEELYTLSALAERIRAVTARQKDRLKLLKLARFGDTRTTAGSLRSDANVIAVTGIEADYDGESMSVDDAIALLHKQGIAAIVYTSPTHTETAPRWRVICPFSQEIPSDRRRHMLGRLNGLFRGIFSHESWTLSQSYYFGSVKHNPAHSVQVIDGLPIDDHDDLDTIWLGPAGTGPSASPEQQPTDDARDDAELVRRVVTGEDLHVALCALAARYTGRGTRARTVEALLQGIMQSCPEHARDERWLDRYSSIGRLVASAAIKYGGQQAEANRAIARLTWRMAQACRPADVIRKAVLEEAERSGLPAERAINIASKILRDFARCGNRA